MIKSPKVNVIVACSENNGIGINGKLPWSLREEMKYFSRMTKATEDPNKKNAVVMGRNTWQSIPDKFRPLPGRVNLLVSSEAVKSPENFPGAVPCENFAKALAEVELRSGDIENIWIIGGASIYKAAFDSGLLHRIYITRILREFECDTFLPELNYDDYKLVQDPVVPTSIQVEGDISYKYEIYEISG